MRYQPGKITNWTELEFELQRIADAIASVQNGETEITYNAPSKPAIGERRFADGVGWNPGGGMGAYSYEGSSTASATWVKL